jgi:peptidyl-prolyl cis-trans isomerase SurA
MNSILFRVSLLVVLFLGGSALAQNSLRIAAVVNDEVISVYSLNSRLALVLASSPQRNVPEARRRLAPQVLRSLIDDRLKLQEARRLNIRVMKDEIDDALALMEERNGLPRGGLDDFLARNGVHKPVLIEQVEANLAWLKTVNRRWRGRIDIGDDEIDGVMAEMKANKGKPEHRVAEIFLPVDDPTHEADVRLLAGRLIQELDAGASFEALARNFSQSASAAVGGDLGWIDQGQLSPDIDAALARLRPGTISRQPIKTLEGYYILMLRGRRADPGLGTDEVTLSLQQLFLPLVPNASQADVTHAVKEAKSLAALANNCADMGNLAKQSGSTMSGSLGKVQIGKLPPALRAVVQDLPIGRPSQPIRLGEGIVVLMVCERNQKDTSEDVVRRKIENKLLADRLSIAARRYLRDLRRSAFVDVRI